MCPHQFLYRNVKGDTTALFLRIKTALCNQIIRSCPGWFCASYFLCTRKNPCANGNDALFHAGFRLQASERNIKGFKFCFHGTITLANVMTLTFSVSSFYDCSLFSPKTPRSWAKLFHSRNSRDNLTQRIFSFSLNNAHILENYAICGLRCANELGF